MKKITIVKVVFVVAILFIGIQVNAQVAINADGSDPDGSAMLDVKSTERGILIPRMTMTQLGDITVVNGLLVYITDDNSFYYYNNSQWIKLSSGGSAQWTSSGFDIYYNDGSVSIGNNSVNTGAILDLVSTEKGFLVPRMTLNERTSMPETPQGTLVYQTDGVSGFYFYQSKWRYIPRSSTTLLSGNTTLSDSHDIVLCSGTFIIALPAISSNNGRLFTIKNSGSGTITIRPSAGEKIDGVTGDYLLNSKKSIVINCYYSGSSTSNGWHIISGF